MAVETVGQTNSRIPSAAGGPSGTAYSYGSNWNTYPQGYDQQYMGWNWNPWQFMPYCLPWQQGQQVGGVPNPNHSSQNVVTQQPRQSSDRVPVTRNREEDECNWDGESEEESEGSDDRKEHDPVSYLEKAQLAAGILDLYIDKDDTQLPALITKDIKKEVLFPFNPVLDKHFKSSWAAVTGRSKFVEEDITCPSPGIQKGKKVKSSLAPKDKWYRLKKEDEPSWPCGVSKWMQILMSSSPKVLLVQRSSF